MGGGFDPIVAEWHLFAKSPSFNLVEKSLKLSQLLEHPDLDVDEYVRKISDIGMSLKESAAGEADPARLVSMLNAHLFENLGYAGDAYCQNPKSILLNEVIDRRSGGPAAISILYAEVAKFVGMDLRLTGFPEHVMVGYGDAVILDPFNGGRRMRSGDLQRISGMRLDGAGPGRVPPGENSPERILRWTARDLRRAYAGSLEYEKALRCADMVLAMQPESACDIRDKGILEGRMLNLEAALGCLNRYLEISPNAEDVDAVLEIISNLTGPTGDVSGSASG